MEYLFIVANLNMFCFFTKTRKVKLLVLLHGYVGRRSVAREDTEEEQFSAILMLMEILTNLLSKDFLSFASGFITAFS